MQTNVQKTAMPIAAGILSIISGAFKVIGFLGLIAVGFFWAVAPDRFERVPPVIVLTVLAIILVALGVLAIIGGVYTLQRKYWGLSLAGAIAALLPFNLLGLAAIILVALSKQEFDWVVPPPPPAQPGQPNPPNPPNPPPPGA